MATLSTTDPNLQSAVQACVIALKGFVNYDLTPSLDRRMRDLGERKGELTSEEREELLALVDFSQKRTIEKLRAKLALEQLQQILPELTNGH